METLNNSGTFKLEIEDEDKAIDIDYFEENWNTENPDETDFHKLVYTAVVLSLTHQFQAKSKITDEVMVVSMVKKNTVIENQDNQDLF